MAIHAALWREHGLRVSYSAVRRMLAQIHTSAPPATTVRLTFAPGDAAQLDFGAGPFLFHSERQQMGRAWAFVMTLASHYFIHDWQHAEESLREQYNFTQSKFSGGVRKIDYVDPVADWANNRAPKVPSAVASLIK